MLGHHAICPFYKYEKDKQILCEYGNLRPPDKLARREIIYQYCGHPENYALCPFYKALDNYYKRKYTPKDNKR